MFRKPERLELLRRVILAETREERIKHLEPLHEMLKGDFKEIFKIMDGLPVIVRLIDPPLHEFLPKPEEVLQQIYEAKAAGRDARELEHLYGRIKALQEANPMLSNGTMVYFLASIPPHLRDSWIISTLSPAVKGLTRVWLSEALPTKITTSSHLDSIHLTTSKWP